MERPWRVFAASSIGKSHIDGSLPCQDAYGSAFDNAHLVAVVCDGAGSASKSDIGARECADSLCQFLSSVVGSSSSCITPSVIEQAIEVARAQLQLRADDIGLPVRELACTVVGVALFQDGGCLFHIGDGMAVVELAGDSTILSLPENGEYANETYFVTGDDWYSHLRTTSFSGTIRCISMMSDGAMPFAVNRGKTSMFAPFIDPVRSYLATVSEVEGSEALLATLSDERTWSITSDDKSLLLILPS
jgi:hypothetical protein